MTTIDFGVSKLKEGTGYPNWKYQLDIIIQAGGLADIVAGTETFETSEAEQARKEWSIKDGRARKYIRFSLDS